MDRSLTPGTVAELWWHCGVGIGLRAMWLFAGSATYVETDHRSWRSGSLLAAFPDLAFADPIRREGSDPW